MDTYLSLKKCGRSRRNVEQYLMKKVKTDYAIEYQDETYIKEGCVVRLKLKLLLRGATLVVRYDKEIIMQPLINKPSAYCILYSDQRYLPMYP